MMRLVIAELRYGWASWAGLMLVAAMSALTSSVAVSFLETGLHVGGSLLEGAGSFLAALLMFSLPSAVIVTSSVASLAVDLHRETYARWQLAGVSPAQTRAVIMAQLGAAGLVGGGLGFAAATVVVPPFVRSVFAHDSLGWDRVPFVVGPLTAVIAITITVFVTLLGGLRAARRAGRTSPLAALRESEPEQKRMRWWRWGLLAVVAAGAWAGIGGVFRVHEVSQLTGQLPLLPVYLMVLIAAAGPLLYPLALRTWTAMIPARASVTWYLARHQARYHLGRSTASITPLFVGASLLGGLMTMAATAGASLAAGGDDRNWNLEIMQVLLLVGGPVLLGAMGAAVVIFMSNRTQGGEQALLRASGATDRIVLVAALLQAIIHVTTAALLAGTVLVTTALIAAAGLSAFTPPVPVVDATASGILVLIGLVLTTLATGLPTAIRLRRPVAAELAAS